MKIPNAVHRRPPMWLPFRTTLLKTSFALTREACEVRQKSGCWETAKGEEIRGCGCGECGLRSWFRKPSLNISVRAGTRRTVEACGGGGVVPGRNAPLFTGFTLWELYKPKAGALPVVSPLFCQRACKRYFKSSIVGRILWIHLCAPFPPKFSIYNRVRTRLLLFLVIHM